VADRIAIDTGPLIALARADALDLVQRLPVNFFCPPEVRAELDEGTRVGHQVVAVPWLRVMPLKGPLDPLAAASVDAAEAAVIQLALEEGIDLVCMDDRKGRRAALAVGLQVTGSLGLLARAKALGLTPAIRPFVERARVEGIWYDDTLVNRLLADLGE
jgi:hypothetical protein